MKTCQCNKCGSTYEFEPIVIGGREIVLKKLCDACIEIQNQESATEQKQAKNELREIAWESICPPLYRNTDPNHPKIEQNTLHRAFSWSDKGDGSGVCLIGPSGRCKTRIMLLLLKRLFFDGVNAYFIPSTRLAWAFQNQFGEEQRNGEARDAITKARNCRVLALDDVGKEKYTETVERDFYDLVEFRTSHLLPTLWTSNADGEELQAMMSKDRGGAIMRRLREFSEPIGV